MKKLIERIKDTFRGNKLSQDVSTNLENTRNIYDFIMEDNSGKSYIPIPKEIYDKGSDMVLDWTNSINKTRNMNSYLSAIKVKENMKERGYLFIINSKELKDNYLIEGNDYILN